MMEKRIRILGLTGNIGSGKSTVSGYLAGKGACIVDADEISRASLLPGGVCFWQVLNAFGEDIRNEDGGINRKKLGQLVFGDPKAISVLNGIVHPYVKETMATRAADALKENPDRLVVLDVPLLIESGMDSMADINALVYVDDAVRLERILKRDSCTEQEARARMQAQMPQADKKAYCQIILDNSGTLAHLYAQVDKLYLAIRENGPLCTGCEAASDMIK